MESHYLPLKMTLRKFVVRYRSGLRAIGATWRPGEQASGIAASAQKITFASEAPQMRYKAVSCTLRHDV